MKKIKTFAIDDEGPALRRLQKMIDTHPMLVETGSAKNSMEAIEKITTLKPELLLMDIQLKDATAFEVLSAVQQVFEGKVIFITAYDQYAVQAFEVEALDYLLKPFTEERFKTAVHKALEKDKTPDMEKLLSLLHKQTKPESSSILIPEGVKNYFFDKNHIHYVYAEGYYSHFVTGDTKKMIRISLKNLEQVLPDDFIRINKSTIVNIQHITEFINHKTAIKLYMPDKNEFYVSATYIKDFKAQLKKRNIQF